MRNARVGGIAHNIRRRLFTFLKFFYFIFFTRVFFVSLTDDAFGAWARAQNRSARTVDLGASDPDLSRRPTLVNTPRACVYYNIFINVKPFRVYAINDSTLL